MRDLPLNIIIGTSTILIWCIFWLLLGNYFKKKKNNELSRLSYTVFFIIPWILLIGLFIVMFILNPLDFLIASPSSKKEKKEVKEDLKRIFNKYFLGRKI